MSIEGDPRVSEADLAAEDDDEAAIRAAEFDLDEFQRQCLVVHEMLNQDTYWVDVHGRRHPLRDMSVRYKANCLAFMRARVGYFAARYPWGAIWAMGLPSGWVEVCNQGEDERGGSRRLTRGDVWLDDGGNMSHAFDQYIEQLEERIRRSPADWLDDTPLMKALSEQVLAGEGGAVGEREEDEPREMCPLDPCPKAGCERSVAQHPSTKQHSTMRRLCTGEWVRIT